jgi:hypothetical protein
MSFGDFIGTVFKALTPPDRDMVTFVDDKFGDKIEITWRDENGRQYTSTYVNQAKEANTSRPSDSSPRARRCSANTHVSLCEDRNCVFHASEPASRRSSRLA